MVESDEANGNPRGQPSAQSTSQLFVSSSGLNERSDSIPSSFPVMDRTGSERYEVLQRDAISHLTLVDDAGSP